MFGSGRLPCVVARRTPPFSEESFVTKGAPSSVSRSRSASRNRDVPERRLPRSRSSSRKGDRRKRGREDSEGGDGGDGGMNNGSPSQSSISLASLSGINETGPPAARRSKRLRKIDTTRSDSWKKINNPRELDVIVATSPSSVVVQRSSALMDQLLQRNRSKYADAPRTRRVVIAMSVLEQFARRCGRFVERKSKKEFRNVPDRLVLPSVVQALHHGVDSLAALGESHASSRGRAANNSDAKASLSGGVGGPERTTPTSTIIPNMNDVLIKGQASVAFSGNSYYEKLIDDSKKAYCEAKSSNERSLIVSSIVAEVKGLTPPGRFLEMMPNGALRDTQDSVAIDCAARALGRGKSTTTAGAHDPSALGGLWDVRAASKSLRAPGLKQGPTKIDEKNAVTSRKSASRLLGEVLFVKTTEKTKSVSSLPKAEKRAPSLVTAQLAHRFAPEAEVASAGKRKVYAKHPLVSAVEVKQPSQEEFAKIGLPRSIIGPPRVPSQEGPIVKEPHMHDVLLGRGPQLSTSPGNLRYRRLVWENKETYYVMSKLDKTDFALDLMNTIRNMDPPGRFLRYDEKQKGFIEVEVQRIIDKTLQALRERKWLDQSSVLRGNQKPASAKNKKPGSKPSVRKGPSIGLTLTDTEVVHDLPPGDDVYDKAVDEKLAKWSTISVYWPLDKAFYTARILDRQKFDVLLKYEEVDLVEWVDLTRHAFRILP